MKRNYPLIIFTLIILILLYLVISWFLKPASTSLYLLEIPLGKTGSEVCYQEGYSCVSVTTARIVDPEQRFYGFVTPSCDSQVITDSSCVDLFDTEYAIDNVIYKKSPNAESSMNLGGDTFCMRSKKGTKGIYEYAYCAKR